jgi:uncharacterized protein
MYEYPHCTARIAVRSRLDAAVERPRLRAFVARVVLWAAAIPCLRIRSGMTNRYWLFMPSLMTASIASVALLARSHFAARLVYVDAAAIFGSALASSIAGFAFSAISGAVLFHDGGTPRHALQIMVVSSIAIQSFSVASLWRSIDWRTLRPFLCGGALGLPIGVFLLYHVPASMYMRAMGVFLLGYGAYMLVWRPPVVNVQPRSGAVIDTIVGVLGGITGGFAAFPGAFVTIWCGARGWDKIRQRAVFQPYILIMQIATIAALSTGAPLSGERAPRFDVTALAYVPLALTGAYLGMRAFQRLSDRGFARVLSLMLIASGIGLAGLR